MLGSIVLFAALVFAGIVPVITLVKYYSPKNLGLFSNLLWIIVAVITWPLVPIALAVKHKDRLLLSLFWSSFLVFAIAGWYWSVLNVQTIMAFQDSLLNQGILK